jgi:hypothetical protein
MRNAYRVDCGNDGGVEVSVCRRGIFEEVGVNVKLKNEVRVSDCCCNQANILIQSFWLLPEFLSNLHQDHSQSVLASSVSTNSPVAVLRTVLHELSISRFQQFVEQLGVLTELQNKSLLHHLLLHIQPVLPQRISSAFIPTVESLMGSGRLNDILLLRSPLELLGLEVVLVGWIYKLSLLELRGEGVHELNVRLVIPIEEDLS